MKKLLKIFRENALLIVFVLLSIGFVIPSVVYLFQNKTVLGFNNYYNFFINNGSLKTLSSTVYLLLYIAMFVIYILFFKKSNIFNNMKKLLIYIGTISLIFVIMLPWTSSDIFYYMGVGELDSVYHQNPYYVTMKEYMENNTEKIYNIETKEVKDEIFLQGSMNVWAKTVVVYGPLTQIIFKILTLISFKNINLCLLIFKLFNVVIHLLNCYIIYRISGKKKFVVLYGLNPFVFLEFIGIVHVDIITVCLVLVSIYYLLKKKNIIASIMILSLATGIKYYTVLLLPVYILYYFRNEEKITIRMIRCLEFGFIFALVFILQYTLYFRNVSVLMTVLAQTTRYCKSIYSGILSFSYTDNEIFGLIDWDEFKNILHVSVFIIFTFFYIVFCIKLLFRKKIRLTETLRKYNFTLIIFLISLSNFQQWYLIWPFASIMWQKPKMIRNLTLITLASEIGNSIYMFEKESWKYDYIFVFIILLIMIVYNIFYKLLENRRNEESKIEENN